MKTKFQRDDIVRPISTDPRCAIFRVLSVAGGWLRCRVEQYPDGTKPSVEWQTGDALLPFKFRTTHMQKISP